MRKYQQLRRGAWAAQEEVVDLAEGAEQLRART
jgi:hypothetical protein